MFAGFGYHYREARVGPFLIGMNSTGAPERGFGAGQEFEMEVPKGAIDMATGKEVSGGTITVEPRETKVFKVASW